VEETALGDRCVIELGELTGGGSKNHARFGRVGQERVVVKIQGTYGRLREEEQALRFLAEHGVCVPRVIDSGITENGGWFLAISREAGAPSLTADGWARCGHDFAGLLDVPIQACPFPRVTTADCVVDHRERLDLVRFLLNDDVVHAISSAIGQIAGTSRLVVTHGDPGGGNYLDNPAGRGVLLDWETASVSPLGLDLGRAAFIGLLDLWQTGIPEKLSSAFIHG
jgi:aminoglycoside phosphotransferase